MPCISNWVLPALLCCGTAVTALVLGAAPAVGGAPVAAVFPPWWSAVDAIAAAGGVGRTVRLGAASFVVIVVPEASPEGGARRSGDIVARLRAAGAVLVVDPVVLGGCAPIAATDV